MASFHIHITSAKRGTASDCSRYITRTGKYARSEDDNDLVATMQGNLPAWAEDDPMKFWNAGDRHERVNGAVCRKIVAALPAELTVSQQIALMNTYMERAHPGKTWQGVIHRPISSIAERAHPHSHFMVSDRMQDQFERAPEKHFSRGNMKSPASGGCRKDSGGRTPQEMREHIVGQRKIWADTQNEALEAAGHTARVDHRSFKTRGINKSPEKKVGVLKLRNLSRDEKAVICANRACA